MIFISLAENVIMYEKNQEMHTNIAVEDYAFLVKRIAHRMMVRMPSSVQVEDLIQSGMIGLLEASQKYDASKGASFETYAGIRIRGAIVDDMRRGDWAPRSVHRNSRRIAEVVAQIEGRTGRDAQDIEVAEALGVTLTEYYDMVRDSSSTRLFSLEQTYENDASENQFEVSDVTNAGPSESIQKTSLKSALAAAIKTLPERERLVLSLYYERELNLKEVGEVLGVSESRVSQIHSQAALRLRTKLTDWQN